MPPARGEIYWNKVGTTLYISSYRGETYATDSWSQTESSTTPPWNNNTNKNSITEVRLGYLNVFNCIGWFKGFIKLVSIRGGLRTETTPDWPQDESEVKPYHSTNQIDNSSSYKEMFSGCSLLEEQQFFIGDGSYLSDLSYMFYNTSKLTYFTIFDEAHYSHSESSCDKRNITTMAYMCAGSKIDTSSFYGFSRGQNSLLNTKSLSNISHMFDGDTTITYVSNLGQLNTSNVTDMSYLFNECTSLEDDLYPFSAWDTSKVQNMSFMYKGCTGLKVLRAPFIDTSSATNMASMFEGCSNLVAVDLANIDISNVTTTASMFKNCSKLKKIYIKSTTNWSSSATLATSSTMFTGCTVLVGENGTVYNPNKVTKDYARFDANADQKGYFSASKRRITASIPEGSNYGSVTGTGDYDYGTFVAITVTPSSGYYGTPMTQTEYDYQNPDTAVLIDHNHANPITVAVSTSFGDIVDEEGEVDMSENVLTTRFRVRNSYNLAVGQEGTNYDIQGQGTYLYLDTPILVVDMNEGAISFLGWYQNNKLVSTQNPYSFTMPNKDYSLVAKFGPPPFTDEKVRQFVLTNSANETYKLTSKDSTIFLNKPTGLGYSKSLSTVRYGDSEDVERSMFNMPRPKGSLYFYADDLEEVYKDYNDFIRFSMRRPFTLWYKIPIIEDDVTIFSTYHLPVEITSIDKSEANELGAIESGIEFYGTGFWKHTEIVPDDISKILNDGDLDAGFEITAQKTNSTTFSNPVITLSTEGEVYGKCALEGTFTKIYINTKDKEQKISLWNGSDTELSDPFTYIDFDASDGTATFPYPKLKNGKITSIEFSYDGMQPGTTNNVLVVYDKEYVSV